MISFSRIGKQYGRQVLFVDASFQLNPGEKVGLVGPERRRQDDALPHDRRRGERRRGRRVGAEEADDRLLPAGRRGDGRPRRCSTRRSPAAAGVGDLHHELEALQARHGRPGAGRRHGPHPRALRRGAGGIRASRRLRARGAGARGAARSRVRRRAHRRRRRRALGRLEDARGDGARAARPARRAADGRADEPSRHRVDHLARGVPEVAAGRAAHDLARPRVHEPHRHAASPRSTAARSRPTRATTTSTSASAPFAKTNREAAYARQQAMLAKEQRFIERFAAHAAKAAQVQSRVKALEKIEKIELPKKRRVVKFDFRQPPRSGDQVAVLEGVSKAYGRRVVYDGVEPDHPARRALVRDGEERRRQDDAAQDGRGRAGARRRRGPARRQPEDGLLRAAGARPARSRPDRRGAAAAATSRTSRSASLRNLAGAFQFSGDDIDKKVRALSGGEKTRLVMARMLLDPPNFLVLDEPTNHLDLATKEMLIEALKDFEGTMLFVSHDRAFLRGLSNRVLELGGERAASRPSRTSTRAHTWSTWSGPGTKRRASTPESCSVRRYLG